MPRRFEPGTTAEIDCPKCKGKARNATTLNKKSVIFVCAEGHRTTVIEPRFS